MKIKETKTMKMRWIVVVAVVLLGMNSVANGQVAVENGSYVSAMYVLGDSSVDCGFNTLLYPIYHHNLSMVPCNNGSDSILLPHLLAAKIGLPPIQPFYSQNGSIDGLLAGVNYGSALATIMNPSSQGLQSLNQQLRQASESFQLLQLQLGQDNAQIFIKSSIVYLSFGKDDYINLFLRNFEGIMLKYSGQEFAHILVDQMVHAMRNLYDANVRKVICMGLLPLGCTPRTVWEWQNATAVNDPRSCVEEINELVLQFNTMLDKHILQLNTELPDAQIVFCDVYKGIMAIISNPDHYGFEDTKNACCGLGLHGAMIGCLSVEMACKEASAHLWWDLYNPTQTANSLIAASSWSGHPFSICRPFSIHDLVSTSVSHLT
ncbi:Lipase_GDSL domain-containing protein [Cephalotus follicularis]|uniref:Lipase_GDSL domain-containing protein n=1 Tax=Cephalotus follicularis TaxID=3775 RepID=A0A1Q3DCJ2_CEPFO|nr:Lipase_GDSL domain-containing protein [Cephalotus follicularis]